MVLPSRIHLGEKQVLPRAAFLNLLPADGAYEASVSAVIRRRELSYEPLSGQEGDDSAVG